MTSQEISRERAMDQAEITAAFEKAVLDFNVQVKSQAPDLIGYAHALYFQRPNMSEATISLQIANLRDTMIALNSAFTRLDLARAAMVVGETASRIRAAAE